VALQVPRKRSICQNGAAFQLKEAQRNVALQEPQIHKGGVYYLDGVLDVPDDDVHDLFDKLAHFLFLQSLGVVLVQHLITSQ
jgi:VanZ family protein